MSVKDELYHRHIIQHDLFAPVFHAFRTNPVGDNLVSSAIVEMCDFIHRENIMSLVEYIVTKHLSAASERPIPSLEDVSSPYVTTLTTLRRAYEKTLKTEIKAPPLNFTEGQRTDPTESHSGYLHGDAATRPASLVLSEKAREDQRKFRESDKEESYFDADDDEAPVAITVVPPGVDEVAAQGGDNDLLRSPRIFSITQAPTSNGAPRRLEDQKYPAIHGEHTTSVAESVPTTGNSK